MSQNNPSHLEQRICAECKLDFTDICPGGAKLNGVWYCMVHAQQRGWIHPLDKQKKLVGNDQA